MRIKRSGMKQNNDIPDKIMERIRKLMRLKESTTSEGEARAAAAAASRLLKEYNLSLFDISGRAQETVFAIGRSGAFSYKDALEARPAERAVPVQLLPDTSLPGHNRHVHRRNR